eukprot:TRINITY_DN4206_c0_g1_i1.p1 TRINITY_DN4206_c0_g1~~TRINITY_DN4206_c0_g1_i1.p1  ORF type:complete len:390 (+),score=58.61 TRINITY_DN4206_c0_g1_i1:57-1226(+)
MLEVAQSFEGRGAKNLMGFSPIKSSVVDERNKMTDEIPSPHISKCAHRALICVYFVLCAAYLTFSIYNYVTRPWVETFTQEASERFPVPEIRIRTQCFNDPFCGEITLTKNYTGASGCPQNPSFQNIVLGSPKLTDSHTTHLCFVPENNEMNTNTGDLLVTPGIVLDFSNISSGKQATPLAYSSVVVEATSSDGSIMRKVVNMESWQVKTFYIAMSIIKEEGEIKSYSYYAQNLQYDGKRPTNRATYVIRLAQFANVYEKTRPGSWIDVLAQLGGAVTVVAALLLLTEPCLSKFFPGGESRHLRGRMTESRGKNFVPLESTDVHLQDFGPAPGVPLQNYKDNEQVSVRFQGSFHPATVISPGEEVGTYNVRWEDGSVSMRVPTSEIKKQ